MCEFCHKHGEGKKWYLQAKNYADDMLSDFGRRWHAGRSLKQMDNRHRTMRTLAMLSRTRGDVRRIASWLATRTMKKFHFGQAVPIEDVERILDLTNSVVRTACVCRYSQGRKDARYCYGVSMRPDLGAFGEIIRDVEPDYLMGPDTAGLEELTKGAALELMREHEHEGLCHTVWTLYTPFIVGICNCDRSGCLGMRMTVEQGVRVMFRAEYVAACDPGLCSGCRRCMRVCQFDAIRFSASRRKAEIDPKRCYGCGVCRAVCAKGAISLADRRAVVEARDIW
ncbi:MAG: 4Fe-4S dicluster domain-containing protein [Planctomycetota bacterium]|jgi:ferredoxin